MKYIKNIDFEILHIFIIFYIIYCISFGILLDIINTNVPINIYQFNIKTISVIGIIISSLIMQFLIKYFKS